MDSMLIIELGVIILGLGIIMALLGDFLALKIKDSIDTKIALVVGVVFIILGFTFIYLGLTQDFPAFLRTMPPTK